MKPTRYTPLYLLLAALPLLATGCDHEQDPAPAQKQSVDFTRITTRTAGGTALPGDFADYGTLHAAISSGNGTPKTATLTYNSSSTTWTCTPELYWPSVTHNTLTLMRGSGGDFTLPADLGAAASTASGASGSASSASVTNYALNDRLWLGYTGSIPSTSASLWQLEHRMAQIRVELTMAEGVTLPSGASPLTSATVSMTLPTAGHFDAGTGVVSRQQGGGATGEVKFYQPDPSEAVFYAVALPGATDTREIGITLGGQEYHYLASSPISLTAGSCHSYKLALTDRMDVQSLSVKTEGEWTDVTVGIKAEENEYTCTTTSAGGLAIELAKTANIYAKVIVNVAAMNEDDWKALTAFVNDRAKPAGDLTINYTGDSEVEIPTYFPQTTNGPITISSLTLRGNLKLAGFSSNGYLTKLVIGKSMSGKAPVIARDGFYNCGFLREVTIEGVTSWEENSFLDCTNLASVTLGEGVTTIGSSAFRGCTQLTSIAIPKGVTSLGDKSFYGCTNLASVTLTEGVTTIGSSAFEGCTQLTSIAIPKGVTSLGDKSFYGCTNLASVTLAEGLKTIGYSAFRNCPLTNITIPKGVTSLGNYSFYGCTNLTSVTLAEGLTTIGNSAFRNCPLTNITIPKGVTSLGDYSFYGCTNLSSVTLAEGLKTIGYSAFQNCTTLGGSITIPSTVTSISEFAFGGTALTSVYIYGNMTWNDSFYDPNAAFDGCTKLETIVLGSDVVSLGSATFRGCSALKKIVLNGTSAITCPTGWGGVFYNTPTTTASIYLYGSMDASSADGWKSLGGKTWGSVHYGFSGTASNIEDLLDESKYSSTVAVSS